jgi:predicted glycoside hydrolase/deacetylase ChbG (UPF0249 family)
VTRILIVNADDCNLTEGVTRGILETHQRGLVTSTTVMVNLPGLERTRDLLEAVPALDVGLHLNLTFGPPVLPPAPGASLVDASGRFVRDPPRQAQAADPRHIREELAAQAGRFQAVFGRRPSHLDSHHHVHRFPGVFEAVLDLAAWLGVALRAVSSEMAGRIRARGLATPDHLIGDVGQEPYWTRERLLATLPSLEEGVTELACHPGYADDALRSSYAAQRDAEREALCDLSVVEAWRGAGVRLAGYRELATLTAGPR